MERDERRSGLGISREGKRGEQRKRGEHGKSAENGTVGDEFGARVKKYGHGGSGGCDQQYMERLRMFYRSLCRGKLVTDVYCTFS